MEEGKTFDEIYSGLRKDSNIIEDVLKRIQQEILNINAEIQTEINNSLTGMVSQLEIAAKVMPNLKQNIEYLFEKAIIDDVTGLNRRAYFNEYFRKQLAQNMCLAYIMTDIDSFGNYNKIYTHQQGDFALRNVAQTVRKSVSEKDFVGRYGGEEFGVIIVQYSDKKKDFKDKAEEIRRNVEKSIILPFSNEIISKLFLDGLCREEATLNHEARQLVNSILLEFYHDSSAFSCENYPKKLEEYFGTNGALNKNLKDKLICDKIKQFNRGFQKITISVGAAEYLPGNNVETLIHRANEALLAAKKEGKNIVCISG